MISNTRTPLPSGSMPQQNIVPGGTLLTMLKTPVRALTPPLGLQWHAERHRQAFGGWYCVFVVADITGARSIRPGVDMNAAAQRCGAKCQTWIPAKAGMTVVSLAELSLTGLGPFMCSGKPN